MKVLILNLILRTAERGVIPRVDSIQDALACILARGFVRQGHEVTIIASEEFVPNKEEDYGFDVIFLKSRYPKLFRPDLLPYPAGLGKYLKNHKGEYDLVVSSEAFSIATLIASRYVGEKLIIWQELSIHQHKFRKLPSKFWYNVITRFANRHQIIIPRSERARLFVSKYSKNVTDEIVDNGADEAIFHPADEVTDTFLVVARLVPGKNINEIIEKYYEFLRKTEYTNYKLVIVGDGPERERLEQEASRLGIVDRVQFVGFLRHQQLSQYMRMSKALMVDTKKDNNMLTIAESIISGTPILTNTVPTNSSYIRKNKLGIAKDGWNWTDMVTMVERYDEFHSNCINKKDDLTNVGCARKIIEIYQKNRGQKK